MLSIIPCKILIDIMSIFTVGKITKTSHGMIKGDMVDQVSYN